MAYPKTAPHTDFNPRRFWITIAGICTVIILGSVFVSRSYLNRHASEAKEYRPPHLGKLEVDLEAINYDGSKVRLGELKGKVWVMGYMYTDCPSGCLGLASYLEEVNRELNSPADLQLVSISLNPKEDTPEKIAAWVKDQHVDLPNWWFLTGDETEIRDYMREWFHMSYGEQSDDPLVVATQGKFQHEPMLVLIDAGGNIRGYYKVIQADIGKLDYKRLLIDAGMVLDELAEAKKKKQPLPADPASPKVTENRQP